MSFTQDELQSFNTILEQKLLLQRHELERSFDQRMSVLRREFEQRLASVEQDIVRNLPQLFTQQQGKLQDALGSQLEAQQERIEAVVSQGIEHLQQQQQQMLEAVVERTLAAQLLAIEQLINQRLPAQPVEETQTYDTPSDIDAIEVQTEVSWEDLVEVIDKAIGERLSTLEEAIQSAVKNAEHYLLTQLRTVRDDLVQGRQNYGGNINNMQDVFTSIEQLERIIESMQVAMTANHALISNRLYHHQHLPLERAHPTTPSVSTNNTHGEGTNNQLPLPKAQEAQQEREA